MVLQTPEKNQYIEKGKIIMPHINKKALNRKVMLSDGSEKKLSQFWEKESLVLVFIRHFG